MSDFERLRRLLLGDAGARLEEQAERLRAIEHARAALPSQLPALLRETQRLGGSERLSVALAAPLAKSLDKLVREQPQTIVDALFPVIGPAIRKAIAEALRDFSEGFNRALESSFTPRGLCWRLECWRSGASYADVVLRHSFKFRIDHLLLIERDSGLVMHRQSAADLPAPDSDAIGGMLTAIGDFVRDSVAGDSGDRNAAGLAAATVGENLLWVVAGPRTNLAVFLRGVPPASLRRLLAERLELLHVRLFDPIREMGTAANDDAAAWAAQLDLAELQHLASKEDQGHPEAGPRRWPTFLLATAVALAIGVWCWRDWTWQQRLTSLQSRLQDWPGLHLDRIDAVRVGEVKICGLLDPLADSPEPVIPTST